MVRAGLVCQDGDMIHLLFALLLRAQATEHPVLLFEKNENPQNIMVAYVVMDSTCDFQRAENGHYFDFYWLMNGTRRKPVHTLIRQGIYRRVRTVDHRPNELRIRFHGLDIFGHEMKDESLEVRSTRTPDGCRLHATAGGLELERVYSQARKTMMPPFRKVEFIRLHGRLIADGTPAERVYRAL